jgi:hypothetical protein
MSDKPGATLLGTVETIMESPFPRASLKERRSLSKGRITRIRRFASRTRSPTKTEERCI